MLEFRYATKREVTDLQGVEVRVRLRDDQEYGGEHAVAAFYAVVQTLG
jgi:hypothetical protein